MPIYEYKCNKCNHKFEKLESFNAESVSKCPVCGTNARRQLSLGSFILKGSGWYAKDSKPAPDKNKEKCDGVCDTCCPANQNSA